MDLTVAALVALVTLVLAIKTRTDAAWHARPSRAYQRVFSAAAIGLLMAGVGLAGGDLRRSHGWFRGVQWSESPVWWQVAGGIALLALAARWARPLLRQPTR
jgi:hypothetical protein